MANPWSRFRSMFRGPAALVPPPTKPAASAPPSTHLMVRKPTLRAASPPPHPEPRPQGKPVAIPPPPRETQLRRDPTAPPPPPPPAVTLAPTTGSVSQSPAPGLVAAAQVQVPAVPAAVAKHPTSPIKTRTASTFSSTTTTPTPTAAAVAVPVPTSTMLSKPDVDARAPPQSPETRLVTPLPSALPKQEKVPVHENAPPANPRHKHNGGGEVKGESAGETQSHGLSNRTVDAQKKVKDRTIKSKPPPLRAFVNSNVQGVNNSVVFDSSCTHHNPGVHTSYSRKPSFDTKGHQI